MGRCNGLYIGDSNCICRAKFSNRWTTSRMEYRLNQYTISRCIHNIFSILENILIPMSETEEGQEITVLLKAILWAIQYPRISDMTNNADRVNVINTVPVSWTVTATVGDIRYPEDKYRKVYMTSTTVASINTSTRDYNSNIIWSQYSYTTKPLVNHEYD